MMLPVKTQSSTQRNAVCRREGIKPVVALAKAGLPTYHSGQGNDADGDAAAGSEAQRRGLFPGQPDRRAPCGTLLFRWTKMRRTVSCFLAAPIVASMLLFTGKRCFPIRRRCDRAAEWINDLDQVIDEA